MSKTYLITGGAGFIGSAVVRYLIQNTDCKVINVDKLTYAGNLNALNAVNHSKRYFFEQVDICDEKHIARIFVQYKPDTVIHLAAESHVDRSIDGSAPFIQTNVVGTHALLEQSRKYWQQLNQNERSEFRFHHVSTDEVYGDLGGSNDLFTEKTSYLPSSPYSASKASSDHLVRTWFRTYGMPVVITSCSNNYGPYQFPEKLIPLVILNALDNKPLPVYGKGEQVRDWLYVEDHVEALLAVANKGMIGETYNIGGNNEKKNIEVVLTICEVLDKLVPGNYPYKNLIEFVPDRPGHDMRYAIDASKISKELNWMPKNTFMSGLRKTILWYLKNR